jgi:hypothetical protein
VRGASTWGRRCIHTRWPQIAETFSVLSLSQSISEQLCACVQSCSAGVWSKVKLESVHVPEPAPAQSTAANYGTVQRREKNMYSSTSKGQQLNTLERFGRFDGIS